MFKDSFKKLDENQFIEFLNSDVVLADLFRKSYYS